jgi:transposase
VLVEDESIFVYDSFLAKKRRWIVKEKRPVVTAAGSHYKTIIYGVLSLDGKQLFRQYERLNSNQSFIAYLEEIRKKFNKFILFADRAAQHRSKMVEEYLRRNIEEAIKIEYFPVGSPQLNAVEECWRQGKYNILSNYYSNFLRIKQVISHYYRTRRFNLDIKKYLFRSTN